MEDAVSDQLLTGQEPDFVKWYAKHVVDELPGNADRYEVVLQPLVDSHDFSVRRRGVISSTFPVVLPGTMNANARWQCRIVVDIEFQILPVGCSKEYYAGTETHGFKVIANSSHDRYLLEDLAPANELAY